MKIGPHLQFLRELHKNGAHSQAQAGTGQAQAFSACVGNCRIHRAPPLVAKAPSLARYKRLKVLAFSSTIPHWIESQYEPASSEFKILFSISAVRACAWLIAFRSSSFAATAAALNFTGSTLSFPTWALNNSCAKCSLRAFGTVPSQERNIWREAGSLMAASPDFCSGTDGLPAFFRA